MFNLKQDETSVILCCVYFATVTFIASRTLHSLSRGQPNRALDFVDYVVSAAFSRNIMNAVETSHPPWKPKKHP